MKRAVVIVLLLAVLAGIVYQRRASTSSTVKPASLPALSVSLQPVRVAPMVEKIVSYGNLVAERGVNIVPETAGLVKQLLFSDGQIVAAGQPLVVMDSVGADAQLQSSRAQAETDLQNLRRTESLSRQGLESTFSREQAKARASASQADVTIAERKLAQLTVRAPFAGVLSSSSIDVGAFVTSADSIVRLEDTNRLKVEFRMPSAVAPRLAEGMAVHIGMSGIPGGPTVDGSLSFIDPTVSTDTRSVLLRALVPNDDRHLRPGLYVRVSIDLSIHPNALVVPISAVLTDLNGSTVFVVGDDHVAHQRSVTTGLANGPLVELRDGVKAGENVVIVGQFRLRDGDVVRPVPAPALDTGTS